MATITLEIYTPAGRVVEASARELTGPGLDGEFGVLPAHRDALIMLGGGAIRYQGDEKGVVYVRGGVAQIVGDQVLVLADEARLPSEADESLARSLLDDIQGAYRDAEFLDEGMVGELVHKRRFAEAMLSTR